MIYFFIRTFLGTSATYLIITLGDLILTHAPQEAFYLFVSTTFGVLYAYILKLWSGSDDR